MILEQFQQLAVTYVCAFYLVARQCTLGLSMHWINYSGGSRSFERGVRVHADYCGSKHCYIMPGREALLCLSRVLKQSVFRAKHRQFSELRTSEITSAGFLGNVQQALVWRSPGLPDLLCRPCITCMAMFIDISPILSTSLKKQSWVELIATFLCSLMA